jgi:uncharacterized protein
MTTKNSKHTSGRFSWHELMTSDVASARSYYGELLGWTFSEMDMGPAGTYTIAKSGATDVGGFMKTEAGKGIPTHWVGYATTPDVDGLAKRVEKLGGKVHVPPTDIPNVGRFTIFADAQGGTLGALNLLEEKNLDAQPANGAFCWDELHTRDAAKAFAQYAELFNWGVKEMDMGPGGTYRVATREGKDSAGITTAQPGKPVMWLSYILVDDVDASTKRSDKLGGKTLVPPTDYPGMGRFSILQDPQGAVFALWKQAAK